MDFDILSLNNMSLAGYRCPACLALWDELPKVIKNSNPIHRKCAVCQTRFLPTNEVPVNQMHVYLTNAGYTLGYKTEDIKTLARHAEYLKLATTPTKDPKPSAAMYGLLSLLKSAKHFIHFTSLGMGLTLLGALKLLSLNVPIRGIVTGVKGWTLDELAEDAQNEGGNLRIRAVPHNPNWQGWDKTSHVKGIVIDGIVLVRGSANMTEVAWRKAATGHEEIQVVTRPGDVIRWNNQYFAPNWYALDPVDDLEMEIIPF